MWRKKRKRKKDKKKSSRDKNFLNHLGTMIMSYKMYMLMHEQYNSRNKPLDTNALKVHKKQRLYACRLCQYKAQVRGNHR